MTHVAPNLGQEKGWDYRCPDGLPGLENRLRAQLAIAEQYGVMLDVHSADDLTQPVRRVIRQATGGKVHYKISPMLQLLFAEVLAEHHPALFRQWWNDALAYARRETAAGSPFAAQCLRAYESAADKTPSRRHMVFHHYSFAFVGRRDERGRFLHRDKYYGLSAGGRQLAGAGCFIEPTVFGGVTPAMTVAREEIFGPVLCLMPVSGFEEAVRLANDVEFGLSSSVFTRSLDKALSFVERTEVGLTHVNLPTAHKEPQLSFGGIKQSGTGLPEAGKMGIEFFTQHKVVYVQCR